MAPGRVHIPLCIALGFACTNDEGPSREGLDAHVEVDSGASEDSSVIDADAGLISDANTEALDGSDAVAGWLPSQCEGIMSPLLNQTCLEALSEACAVHQSERECASQDTLNINDYDFRCGWARVVSFADASACEGARSTGRCVAAYFDRTQGCSNPCQEPSNPDMRSPFTYSDADELVERPCGPSGRYLGPVGSGAIGRCESGPAHPLCGCAAAACAVP
jgi:hypothetical protein